VLARGLRAKAARVDEVVLYEARVPGAPDREVLAQLREGRVDAITFASSSSVRNLAMLLGDHFERLKAVTVACIGPVTAQTAREYGLEVAVEPRETSIEALADGLAAYFAAVSSS
jgi:uroporphyrinogen III methyltransferase/synthase